MNELELLVEVSNVVGRMETKLDTVIERMDDHEVRIRSVEKWKWSLPGAGVLATIVAAISAFPHK
jgi:flagellar motor component MotA